MDWNVLPGQWPNFLLVFLRTGCLLFFWPVWDSRFIPVQVRVFSLLVISLALTPLVAQFLPPLPDTWTKVLGIVLREFLFGLSLGLLVRFLLAGAQMAGNLLSIQMGFGLATLLDPHSQGQATVLADLFLTLALLVFLAIDGHHFLLRFLVLSFQEVPMGDLFPQPGNLVSLVPKVGALMYRLALMLAAPVLAALFLTQVALGLLARAVPQIQVMILSFPLTIALGLLILSFTLTMAGHLLADNFVHLKTPLHQVLRIWRG